MLIQNQTGNHPRRWEKTGRVVEALDNRQFRVKVDGSNRITLRNRRFLKRISPIADLHPAPHYPQLPSTYSSSPPAPVLPMSSEPKFDINRQLPPTEVPTPYVTLPLNNVTPPAPNQGMPELVQQTAVPTTPPPLLDLPQSPSAAAPEPTTLPPAPTEGLRRSNRAPKPRRALSPVMHGKRHHYTGQ